MICLLWKHARFSSSAPLTTKSSSDDYSHTHRHRSPPTISANAFPSTSANARSRQTSFAYVRPMQNDMLMLVQSDGTLTPQPTPDTTSSDRERAQTQTLTQTTSASMDAIHRCRLHALASTEPSPWLMKRGLHNAPAKMQMQPTLRPHNGCEFREHMAIAVRECVCVCLRVCVYAFAWLAFRLRDRGGGQWVNTFASIVRCRRRCRCLLKAAHPDRGINASDSKRPGRCIVACVFRWYLSKTQLDHICPVILFHRPPAAICSPGCTPTITTGVASSLMSEVTMTSNIRKLPCCTRFRI